MMGGLMFLTLALLLTVYNLNEANAAAEASESVAVELVRIIEENASEKAAEILEEENSANGNASAALTITPDYVLYPDKEMPTMEIDSRRYYGVLEIPDLNLVLPVLAGEWSYEKLRIAPCWINGSVYKDDMVIAAHNYIRHFSGIRRLSVGAVVRFIDAEGNVFEYTVAWAEILSGTDWEEMVEGDDWDLTLYTCNYGGQKRYTVRCIRTN